MFTYINAVGKITEFQNKLYLKERSGGEWIGEEWKGEEGRGEDGRGVERRGTERKGWDWSGRDGRGAERFQNNIGKRGEN